MDYLRIEPPFKAKKKVLAFGAQSKSSVCFSNNGSLYLSVGGGDLSRPEDLEKFETCIDNLNRKLNPDIAACDFHPGYASSRLAEAWSRKRKKRLEAFQHHESHLASCIADNKLKENVIGVIFDGTGLGLDGNVWGGEFFVGNIMTFKRAAHLRYIPMPGGELSIREPWRMALSYLYDIDARFLNRWDLKKAKLIVQAIDKGINSPLTSSMGRLFDAVSSLCGICDAAEYEAQGAIELEKRAARRGVRHKRNDRYSFAYKDKDGVIEVDWSPLIRGVVKDLRSSKSRQGIPSAFHKAVCYMIKDVCAILSKKHGVNKVCMSGGVFQNRYLTANIVPILREEGLEVYLHKDIPVHDGNIALGQAVLAGNRV